MPRLSLATTQSAANTFTSSAQVTGLEGQTTTAFKVLEARFEIAELLVYAGAADEIEFALARQTKLAMPNVADVDVMFKHKSGINAAGNSGIAEGIIEWVPHGDVFIVEDPIFLMVLTASIAAAQVVVGEIFFETVQISAIDRLTLLTQSLSGA